MRLNPSRKSDKKSRLVQISVLISFNYASSLLYKRPSGLLYHARTAGAKMENAIHLRMKFAGAINSFRNVLVFSRHPTCNCNAAPTRVSR